MRNKENRKQIDMWSNNMLDPIPNHQESDMTTKNQPNLPNNIGKAIRLNPPDFSDLNRKLTCLEVDFPIAQINALSNLEGNAGKPIYQMSKWWARRRSSVFRSLLIAAATEGPDDPSEAAKKIWDHYYCNHQKAGSFKHLKVLDCFMGGGTTLVEGSRLGMQVTGVDLNPVAWFVVKNELACSDPEQTRAFFDYIEAEVKPQIQPFYTTTCPRGHKGKWIDIQTSESVDIDPMDSPPEERRKYRWQGPEIIYTFWAKHGPCQAKSCNHRTPTLRTPIISEKALTTTYIELTCPGCRNKFHTELGETRMAPGAQRVVLDGEPSFVEMQQDFAKLLNDYDKGTADDTVERMREIKNRAHQETGLKCPVCGFFAGQKLLDVIDQHSRPKTKASQRKKKDFGLQRKSVQMWLLVNPEWLTGASGFDGARELGGYAGAPVAETSDWFLKRLENLNLTEVRGKSLPSDLVLQNGKVISTTKATVPRQAHFTCASCGREGNILESVRPTGHTAPLAAYALQCHCPQCESEGYNYGGRYFKLVEPDDVKRLILAEREWVDRNETDLNDYWPRSKLLPAYMTHKLNGGIPNWGYTHWWKMFNPRQLLIHAQLLKAITEAPHDVWAVDVREQALGAFQQYLRNQNMFAFYHVKRDCLAPALSNANYHPKLLTIEVSAYSSGYGPWKTTSAGILGGLEWAHETWDPTILPDTEKAKSIRVYPGDPVRPASADLFCASSTDLSMLNGTLFDLVITDPPFGNNLFYADLADFFYVWLRIPLLKWYVGLPEQQYFVPERTPHSLEAVDNSVEHPENREEYEKTPFVEAKHLTYIRKLSHDYTIEEKGPNPLFRPEPSSEFYCQTLSACWAEAGKLLRPSGVMAFTFHHNDDRAWIDILRALFDAGYLLVATYPIRSDETKGESGAFGSRKIEYDIIHVCRKRIEQPGPVSWARMRRWVKSEAERLKELLEHSHGKELPESDLRVIFRGKALEFYSRHYGQVFTGDGQSLDIREALLGINQLLDDLVEIGSQDGNPPPPDVAEPASRLYLRLFGNTAMMDRDELHKTLRGTGVSQSDLEARGWIQVTGRVVRMVTIKERFTYFTGQGRNRKVIKTDLDQAHFLIGAASTGSGIKVEDELNNPNFRIKKSVDELLKWYAARGSDPVVCTAALTALQIVERWRTRNDRPEVVQPTFFNLIDES